MSVKKRADYWEITVPAVVSQMTGLDATGICE